MQKTAKCFAEKTIEGKVISKLSVRKESLSMDYISDYQEKMLELIKKYYKEEYDELIGAPLLSVLDHLDYLEEKYPTLEEFENNYCKKLSKRA